MRLLNAISLRVESVVPDSVPAFAILSHRWTDDEVSFQDINTGAARKKSGFAKVQGCCDRALRDGYSYVWIDTCCIDSTSSAELSEAINSMFRWYKAARVCYVYLYDATGVDDFLLSEWFDRGWTLQELVAPSEVRFYNQDWIMFGDKIGLSASISVKTGIAEIFLRGQALDRASIAERMSWAAHRKTTREEDMSYCLLGLFDVHMPLLYGEGAEKAFARLQSQLIKETSDQSWLAWGSLPNSTPTDVLSGVVAKSPAYFWKCRDIVLVPSNRTAEPISESNLGIHFNLPLVTTESNTFALLECHWRHDFSSIISIPLVERNGRYFRASLDTDVCDEEVWSQAVRKPNTILSSHSLRQSSNSHEDLYFIKKMPRDFQIFEVYPPYAWEPSPAHIRARKDGISGLVPLRLARLRLTAEDGRSNPEDYVLKLHCDLRNGIQHPVYALGILPRDRSLHDATDRDFAFGKAITIPGRVGALSVHLKMRAFFGIETSVVEIYMDQPRAAHPTPASESRILAEPPSVIAKNKAELVDFRVTFVNGISVWGFWNVGTVILVYFFSETVGRIALVLWVITTCYCFTAFCVIMDRMAQKIHKT